MTLPSVASAVVGTAATQTTETHSAVAVRARQVLIVIAHSFDASGGDADVTGATFDGTAMTELGEQLTDGGLGGLWGCTVFVYAPGTATTGDIVVTWGEEQTNAVSAYLLMDDVKWSDISDAVTEEADNNTTAASVDHTTVHPRTLVLAFGTYVDADSTGSISAVGTGDTLEYNQDDGTIISFCISTVAVPQSTYTSAPTTAGMGGTEDCVWVVVSVMEAISSESGYAAASHFGLVQPKII